MGEDEFKRRLRDEQLRLQTKLKAAHRMAHRRATRETLLGCLYLMRLEREAGFEEPSTRRLAASIRWHHR